MSTTYPLEIEGWSGKNNNCNAGLLYTPHKPNAVCRVFDRDYSTHMFNMSLKNALYNRRGYESTICFISYHNLCAFKYATLSDINVNICLKEGLLLSVDFDTQKYSSELLERYIIDVQWYEKDISIAPLATSFQIELAKLIASSDVFTFKVVCDGYFRTPSYISECLTRSHEYNKHNCISANLTTLPPKRTVSIEIPLDERCCRATTCHSASNHASVFRHGDDLLSGSGRIYRHRSGACSYDLCLSPESC